jgi:nucleoid-associated protein YgaU
MAIAAEHLGLRPIADQPRLRVVSAGPARGALRPAPAVYRRRRLLAAVALLVLAGVAVLGWSGLRAQDATAAVPVAAQTVVVAPGDTVWDLARAHAPAGVPVSAYALEIARVNGVEPASLAPGSVLRLPAR